MNNLPAWVAWLLAIQTIAVSIASAIVGLAWKSFQAGAVGSKYVTRLEDVERQLRDANPRLSSLASRMQGMQTTEELRDVFLSQEVADERREEAKAAREELWRRLAVIEESLAGFRRTR